MVQVLYIVIYYTAYNTGYSVQCAYRTAVFCLKYLLCLLVIWNFKIFLGFCGWIFLRYAKN
jgi:hypothetical protein